MKNKKLNLDKTNFDEILNRQEMKEIMIGSGSGSGSGSPPQSACTATCTCPDGNKKFEVKIVCLHDCRAVSEQGVECVVDGVPKGAFTCSSAYQSQCYYSI